VPHHSRLFKVVIDVAPEDHDREVAFWEGATGQTLTQRLDGGASRVHLDIHTDDLEAEVARLERLGAQAVTRVRQWCVMRDPAGLLFCVIPDTRQWDETNSTRWP
jgi:hypothetical protein